MVGHRFSEAQLDDKFIDGIAGLSALTHLEVGEFSLSLDGCSGAEETFDFIGFDREVLE